MDVAHLFRHDQRVVHVFMAAAAERITEEDEGANLVQLELQRSGLAAHDVGAHRGRLKPIGTSGAVNCRTTGGPFFT